MPIAIIIPINAFKSKILIFFHILFLCYFALLLENLLLAYIFVYSIILFSKSFVKNKQKNQQENLNFFYYLNLYYFYRIFTSIIQYSFIYFFLIIEKDSI